MKGTHNVASYAFTIGAAMAFVLVSLLSASGARPPAAWRGYHTLLVSDGIPLEEVVSRLERRIPPSRIVSGITSTVSITTFGGREEVGVAEIESRLDSRDPRLDEYALKLEGMFHGSLAGKPANVLYVSSALAPPLFAIRAARLLSGLEGEWSLAGPTPAASLIPLAAALLYLALVAWSGRSPGSMLFAAGASLPWLASCALGGLSALLPFFLVFPFCLSLLAELRDIWPTGRRPALAELASPRVAAGLVSLGVSVAAAAALLLALGGEATDVLRCLAALGADALFLVSAVLRNRMRGRRAAHSVFAPVVIGRSIYRFVRRRAPRRRLGFRPLLESARGILVGRPAELALVLAVVCLSPLLTLLGERGPAVWAPAPAGDRSQRVSWESLERLWLLDRADELPNVADYVAHEAYQSSLQYGGIYRLPSRREAVTVRSFSPRSEGPGLVAGERTVARFDDRWLRAALGRARPGSVDALLASQRRALRVGRAREAPALSAGAELWRTTLSSVMVAFFLVMGSRYLGPSVLFGSSRPALQRRRAEEA